MSGRFFDNWCLCVFWYNYLVNDIGESGLRILVCGYDSITGVNHGFDVVFVVIWIGFFYLI